MFTGPSSLVLVKLFVTSVLPFIIASNCPFLRAGYNTTHGFRPHYFLVITLILSR